MFLWLASVGSAARERKNVSLVIHARPTPTVAAFSFAPAAGCAGRSEEEVLPALQRGREDDVEEIPAGSQVWRGGPAVLRDEGAL
eukprot:9354197-Pyramimonas_sp.AAC.1